jgi:hypothetical protein
MARYDLPRPDPLPISVWSRADLTDGISRQVARDLRRLLAPAPHVSLAQGA